MIDDELDKEDVKFLKGIIAKQKRIRKKTSQLCVNNTKLGAISPFLDHFIWWTKGDNFDLLTFRQFDTIIENITLTQNYLENIINDQIPQLTAMTVELVEKFYFNPTEDWSDLNNIDKYLPFQYKKEQGFTIAFLPEKLEYLFIEVMDDISRIYATLDVIFRPDPYPLVNKKDALTIKRLRQYPAFPKFIPLLIACRRNKYNTNTYPNMLKGIELILSLAQQMDYEPDGQEIDILASRFFKKQAKTSNVYAFIFDTIEKLVNLREGNESK